MEVSNELFAHLLHQMARPRQAQWPCPYNAASLFEAMKRVLQLQPHPNTEAFAQEVWEKQQQRPWLLILGGVGRGKTIAMRCVLAAIAAGRTKPRQVYCNARVLAQNEEMQNKAKQAELLAIDDIGTEPAEVKNYGTATQPIAAVIEFRYDANLPIYFTTNLRGGELSERYGSRIVSRMNEMCGVVDADKYFKESLR